MKHKTWRSKKVIVTGGAGFIGSKLVKTLVSLGANVKVLDNLWRGSLENLKNKDNYYMIDIKNTGSRLCISFS